MLLVAGAVPTAQAQDAPRPAAVGRALAPPTVAGPVEAALRLTGAAPVPARPAPAPLPAGLPAGLEVPLGRLLGAVATAQALAEDAVRPGRPLAAGTADLLALGRAAASWRPGRPLPQAPYRADRVDQAALAQALHVVARTVDAVLPALALQASRPPARPVPGCDVLDRLPLLCVGSSADNVHTTDAAVLVDLGGDDVHRHSAGGAVPLAGGPPVAVTVDLAGDDSYPDLPAQDGELSVGLGSGVIGGVGLLVDVEGDDRYARPGQGLGVHGAGALVDLAGDDEYRAQGSPVGVAGGVGAVGVGVLADHAGDDSYTVSATSARQQGRWVDPAVLGMGVGMAGVGLQWDGGGRDVSALQARAAPAGGGSLALGFGAAVFQASAVSGWGEGPSRRSVLVTSPGRTPHAQASVLGAGAALAGSAVLRDASGDDRTQVTLRTGPGQAPVGAGALLLAFGVGVLGTGTSEDGAGDDHYTAVLDTAPPGTPPRSTVAGATVLSHGAGLGQAAQGRLTDRSGDDAYTVEARAPGGTHDAGPALGVLGQGFGSTAASGVLRDLGGADRYDVRARSVHGRHPAAVHVQGAGALGHGALTDVDRGRPDVFRAEPAPPTCLGARGSAYWLDCWGGTGSAT